MKKLISLACLLWLCCLSAAAQTLVTRNFEPRPTDPTATLHGSEVKDKNGKTTALVKIRTPFPATDLGFDSPLYGVTQVTQHSPGEVWVYLPERTQRLTIIHPVYGSATQQFIYDSGSYLKSGQTYSLDLNAEGKQVSLVASSPEAVITLDDVEQGRSPVNTYIPYGAHNVTARNGSLFYEGTILVTKDGPDTFDLPLTDENLLFGDVTIETPEGVEIWFRNRREGVGEFTTRLREGQYSVETRKRDHTPALSTFTVKAGQSQTVHPDLPTPHKGFLDLTTVPENGVTILSGDTVFTAERAVQVPVGTYELTFTRKGWNPQTRIFRVNRGETTSDTVVLRRKQYVRKNGLQAGVGFVPLSTSGLSFHLGGVIANVEIEAQYTLGLSRSKEVQWFSDEDQILSNIVDYRCDEFGVTLGYRLSFAERFGLTPRVGYSMQYLSAKDKQPGNGFNVGLATVGVKALFKPFQHFGIYVTPSYGRPLSNKEDDHGKLTFDLAGIKRGGMRLDIGIEFDL